MTQEGVSFIGGAAIWASQESGVEIATLKKQTTFKRDGVKNSRLRKGKVIIYHIHTYFELTGTKASPRSWESWNFESLEPLGLRKGERIQEDAAKGKKY